MKRGQRHATDGRGTTTRGQSFVEYTLMIGVVVAVLLAMGTLYRRAIQGAVKLVADQIGNQNRADQPGGEQGYLVLSNTITRTSTAVDRIEEPGVVGFDFRKGLTHTERDMYANQGFFKY